MSGLRDGGTGPTRAEREQREHQTHVRGGKAAHAGTRIPREK